MINKNIKISLIIVCLTAIGVNGVLTYGSNKHMNKKHPYHRYLIDIDGDSITSCCQDTLHFWILNDYLDEYYSYNYSYPSSIDSLLLFIEELNGEPITKDSYYGEVLLKSTIPQLNSLKDRSIITVDEESFKIYNSENKLVYRYKPPYGTPCEYIKFINESKDLDKFIPGFHSNVLFFDSCNKAIMENTNYLTTEFTNLKKSVLNKQKQAADPYYNSVGILEYAFYQFDSQTGLSVMCENKISLNVKIYKELNQKLYDFTNQNHISRIIFCMPVYKKK